MNSLLAVFLLIFIAAPMKCQEDYLSLHAGLVIDVFTNYRSSCVYLLHYGHNDICRHELQLFRPMEVSAVCLKVVEINKWISLPADWMFNILTELQKVLSTQNVISSAHTYPNLPLKMLCKGNKPLVVLLNANKNTGNHLTRVSNYQGLSRAVWLLLLTTTTAPQAEILSKVHVPFDSEFLVAKEEPGNITLVEVYQVAAGLPLREELYGFWTPTGVKPPLRNYLFQRRNNLHGLVLRVAYLPNPPTTMSHLDSAKGYVNIVWEVLEKQLNFKIDYQPLTKPDWNELINMLINDAIDFTGNTVMMNIDRVSAVQFTTPVLYASYRVFLRQPEQQIKVAWTSFLRPFSRTLWLAISVYFMVLSLLLFYCTPFYNENLKFKDTIFYVFIISCNQGLVTPPQNSSAQLLLLSASLTTVVIMAAYSAGLVSSLAAKDQRLPFNTLQELLDEGSHQFGTVDHSAEKELFISSKDPVLRQLYDKVMSSDTSNFPSSIGGGLERVCTTRYAFLAPLISVLGRAEELPCRISMLPYVFMKAGLPFATPKNSTYRRLFNHKIRQMWDSGIFSLIMAQKLPKILYEEPKSISVHLKDVTPILVLLAVGIFVAWCVLLLETIRKRH